MAATVRRDTKTGTIQQAELSSRVDSLSLVDISQVGLPGADLDCDLAQYVDIICGE